MADAKLSRLFERYRTKNDLAALAEVFDAVSPELLRVARHLAGRRGDPEDLVQATFLAAIERASTFDAERPLVPWLVGILINQSRLARRRLSPNLDEETTVVPTSATQELDLEAGELNEAVSKALGELPDSYKDVLVAHLAEGKKPHEIARDLGRPQGTVRAQIHRGLRLLRRSMPVGLSLGALAMFRGSGLAQVRRDVLAEAARRAGLPPPAAPSAAVRISASSIGIAVVCGALWLALRPAASESALERVASANVADLEAPASSPRVPAAAERAPDAAPAAAAQPPPPVPGATHGTLVVVVQRGDDPTPIAGQRVRLLPWGDPRWFERVDEGVSDRDGIVRFERQSPGRAGVFADDGSHAREWIVAGREMTVKLQLAAGVRVTGRVVDASGRPVAGALVDVIDEFDAPPAQTSAPTDAAGEFVLEGVDRMHWVAARHERVSPSRCHWLGIPAFGDATARVELVLGGPGALVRGRVVDELGAPVASARVRIEHANDRAPVFGGDGSVRADPPAAYVATDDDGRFELAGVPSQRVRVGVEAARFARAEIALEAGERGFDEVVFRLERGGSLSGVARYSDGQLAPGASIEVHVEGFSAPLVARCDSAGAYSFPNVPRGAHALVAREGLGPTTRETLEFGPQQVRAWDPRIERQRFITGRVVGEDGRFVKVWLVRAVPETPSDAARARPLETWIRENVPGSFEETLMQAYMETGVFHAPCTGDGPHRLELRARRQWRGNVYDAFPNIPAGATDVVVRVKKPQATVHGVVLGADRLPLAHCRVLAISNALSGQITAEMQPATGAFKLELMPGEYELVAWGAGEPMRHLGRYTFEPTEHRRLEPFVFAPQGGMRARFQAADGEPPPFAFELCTREGLRVECAREGELVVADGLAPGGYELTATSASARRTFAFDVAPGERSELVLAW